MNTLSNVADVLLILAFLGFVGVLIWLGATAVHIKNSVVGNGKKLYSRPAASVKNLTVAGKGIVQQETVRVKRIGATGLVAVHAVQATVAEAKVAVDSLREADLGPILQQAQTAAKFASAVAQTVKAAKQEA
ncbi:hypothetical protein CCAX7_002280 [Capsulimonas corticalis]|uniref:Uncharacterized protein n=1 Tax=Capsulimonas corticalis TaxID=2219043 RepID=A0A402CRW1_9BACT|nr:hypothetical protein [Capsulimonas corticalis]BDI28177.1 hypothetical protein CCAX7_002280 [Capsulimonas corticalis]